jgi:hypothetical protein
MKNSDTKNPDSLYQDGKNIHNKTKEPGYLMNPESQGLHGKSKHKNNKLRTAKSKHPGPDYWLLAAGGAALAVATVFGWQWLCKKRNYEGESLD